MLENVFIGCLVIYGVLFIADFTIESFYCFIRYFNPVKAKMQFMEEITPSYFVLSAIICTVCIRSFLDFLIVLILWAIIIFVMLLCRKNSNKDTKNSNDDIKDDNDELSITPKNFVDTFVECIAYLMFLCCPDDTKNKHNNKK